MERPRKVYRTAATNGTEYDSELNGEEDGKDSTSSEGDDVLFANFAIIGPKSWDEARQTH